jgi:signal peptidase II
MVRLSASPAGSSRRELRMLVTAGAIVVADQLVKALVVATMRLGQSIDLLGTVVRFTRTANTGAAFGLLRGRGTIFIIVSAAAALAITAFRREIAKMRRWEQLAFALILGGAVGNLIDRIRLGSVVDFIDIGVNAARWPAFNIADSAISVGVVILAINLIFVRGAGTEEPHVIDRRETP